MFKVESVSGEPIAFVVNNGPQPTFGMVNPSEVTSDVAGATERYVEQLSRNRQYGQGWLRRTGLHQQGHVDDQGDPLIRRLRPTSYRGAVSP